MREKKNTSIFKKVWAQPEAIQHTFLLRIQELSLHSPIYKKKRTIEGNIFENRNNC